MNTFLSIPSDIAATLHQTEYDDHLNRYYYASNDPLLIIVTYGFDLSEAAGRVCDATIGLHHGRFGYVLQQNLKYEHTKITLRGIVNREAETTWQEAISQSRRK